MASVSMRIGGLKGNSSWARATRLPKDRWVTHVDILVFPSTSANLADIEGVFGGGTLLDPGVHWSGGVFVPPENVSVAVTEELLNLHLLDEWAVSFEMPRKATAMTYYAAVRFSSRYNPSDALDERGYLDGSQEHVRRGYHNVAQLLRPLGEFTIDAFETPPREPDADWLDLASSTPSQSSTMHGGKAKRGIDGNSSMAWNDRGCTHTALENEPWWKVVLPVEHVVHGVEIMNRGDGLSSRIVDAVITVDGEQCAVIEQDYEGGQYFECTTPLHGREVKVQIKGREEYLTVCEVRVRGQVAEACGGELEPPCGGECGEGLSSMSGICVRRGVACSGEGLPPCDDGWCGTGLQQAEGVPLCEACGELGLRACVDGAVACFPRGDGGRVATGVAGLCHPCGREGEAMCDEGQMCDSDLKSMSDRSGAEICVNAHQCGGAWQAPCILDGCDAGYELSGRLCFDGGLFGGGWGY